MDDITISDRLSLCHSICHEPNPEDRANMLLLKNIHGRIIGIGSAVPKKTVSNQEVIRRGCLDTTEVWIREHAGIAERRVLGKGESNFTMAVKAARQAIKNAKVSPQEIGLVVVGSETAEQYLPATASLIRDVLGLRRIPAWDVNSACASFMTGFAQATFFVERADVEYALVIGVDSLFEHQDPNDRDSAIIFGDGAGAVVLKKSKKPMMKEIVLSSVPGGNAITNPLDGYFKMDRVKVKENILELVLNNLSKENCKSIDHFFFHQASKRVLDEISSALNISREKMHSTLSRYGNTGAASIPITLDMAVKLKKIRKRERVLLCGFGAGYEYVHAVVEW